MTTARGILLLGPRSLDERAAGQVRDQARWFVELNKHKCSFILLPDLPGTSPEACNALPDWLEVIILSPGRWMRPTRWEQKHYDNVLELPLIRGYHEDDAHFERNFARYSYRFGIDWVVPYGALLAFRGPRVDPEVEGAIRYARTQGVQVFTRSTS
jgi:hypothetical protein